jgi:hypothetical protein
MAAKVEGGDKTSGEAHAYTPGLNVKRNATIVKTRRLPIRGEVIVNVGDTVEHDTVVAKTEISGDPEIVKAAVILDVEAEDLSKHLSKGVGDSVVEGERLAYRTSFFGLIKKELTAPMSGTIESISDHTGQMIIRGAPIPIEVEAYIPGRVVEVLPGEGAAIEANAAFIQGIFGIGGETYGKIRVAVEAPDEELTADLIHDDDRGAVVVGGSMITRDAFRRGVEVGVSALVAGGVRHSDLIQFTGEEIGVAITGEEELGLTALITEGFGRMRMSQRTFELLKGFEGCDASVNGATQIRAGVLRPEIIIPHDEGAELGSKEDLASGMVPGTRIRIIRQPYFGAIGEVHSLPVELQQLESESRVRVLDVELGDGSVVTVPRANVEIIEE